MKTITQGRYTANIRSNDGSFCVLVTRDGDCLPGIGSRMYADMRKAEAGALRLLAKAAA